MGKVSAARARKDVAGSAGGREKASGGATPGDRGRGESADTPELEFAPPLRPRPRLLMGLSVLLGLWVAFLLVLYFRTVYPERRANDPRTSAPLTSESAQPPGR